MKRVAAFLGAIFLIGLTPFLMAPTGGGSYFYTLFLNGNAVPRIAYATVTGTPSTCTFNRGENFSTTCTYNSVGNYTLTFSPSLTSGSVSCTTSGLTTSAPQYAASGGESGGSTVVVELFSSAGAAVDGVVKVICAGYP